jgi:hypothetical protein
VDQNADRKRQDKNLAPENVEKVGGEPLEAIDSCVIVLIEEKEAHFLQIRMKTNHE